MSFLIDQGPYVQVALAVLFIAELTVLVALCCAASRADRALEAHPVDATASAKDGGRRADAPPKPARRAAPPDLFMAEFDREFAEVVKRETTR